MGYLTLSDYRNSIQQAIFNQLVQNNYAKLALAEDEALNIIIEHLQPKYDVNNEFLELLPWNPDTTYNIRDRVIIDYDAWVAAHHYDVNNCIIQNGIGYICTTANSDAAFDPANWTPIGAQYAIYYASFPSTCTYRGIAVSPTLADPLAPMFDYNKSYFKGDIVYWKGNIYTCNMATTNVQPHDLKQYFVYENVPLNNVFPDSAVDNAQHQFWTAPTSVVVEAGTLPTGNNAWTLGDNRNSSVKKWMKNIAIYILSDLIVTNNRPIIWKENYDSSISKLKDAARGDTITLRIPRIQPNEGKRVRYGGGVRQQWTY